MSSKHLTEGSRQPSLNRGRLRLYSMRFCPFAHRVRLVLDAKKISYDIVNINLSSKPEWFLEKNPLGKVPALEVEPNQVIYDSLIITDYLDEKYPLVRLNSTDPLQKAKDRILLDRFNTVPAILYKVVYGKTSVSVEEQRDVLVQGLKLFESELATRGQYFGGSKPGLVDYMIWPWCERAELLKTFGSQFPIRKEDYKRLLEWRALMREDPAVKKNYMEPEVYAKYSYSHRAGTPDYDLVVEV